MIHLRAYAQKTPINEYKSEAFALFERMLTAIREEVTRILGTARFEMTHEDFAELPPMPDFVTSHIDPFTGEDDSADRDAGSLGLITTRAPQSGFGTPDDDFQITPEIAATLGRNSQCPCGSGRKYKHCHGAL